MCRFAATGSCVAESARATPGPNGMGGRFRSLNKADHAQSHMGEGRGVQGRAAKWPALSRPARAVESMAAMLEKRRFLT